MNWAVFWFGSWVATVVAGVFGLYRMLKSDIEIMDGFRDECDEHLNTITTLKEQVRQDAEAIAELTDTFTGRIEQKEELIRELTGQLAKQRDEVLAMQEQLNKIIEANKEIDGSYQEQILRLQRENGILRQTLTMQDQGDV